MMYLAYENDLGRVDMSGNGQSLWSITAIEGLGLASKNFNTVVYAGQDGQSLISETSVARTITIGGDIKNRGDGQYELSKALRILNKPGELTIRIGVKERKINCRCNTFETDRRNLALQPFALQLIADKPTFKDIENTTIAIFIIAGGIEGVFHFPLIMSVRTNTAVLSNLGDVKTEPIIYIYNTSGGTGAGIVAPVLPARAGIEINNTTTGQIINLLYSTGPGEVVTIDVEHRTIQSNIRGNLIKYISSDTFLSGFWLEVGMNSLSVINHSEGEVVNVVCEFSNRYIEAVM